MTTTRKLTEKQRRFVEAYMGQAAGNATEAARLAGYKGNADTLARTGSDNIRKTEVAAAIADRVSGDPLVATREERQRFYTEVMRGMVESSVLERLKACELLGKTQGDFVERREVDVRSFQAVVILPDNGRVKLEDGDE